MNYYIQYNLLFIDLINISYLVVCIQINVLVKLFENLQIKDQGDPTL
jgi:hypothetical protein